MARASPRIVGGLAPLGVSAVTAPQSRRTRQPPGESLDLHATIDDVPAIRQFVVSACARLGADEGTTFRCALVADELCTNALTHGSASGTVRFTVHVTGDATMVHLHLDDDGAAFDPRSRFDTARDDPLTRSTPGGFGLHLVGESVDEAAYGRTRTHNHTRLTFRAPASR
ncbi:MAG: ATP-binding protein [Nitriliruptoraceae bacterium]